MPCSERALPRTSSPPGGACARNGSYAAVCEVDRPTLLPLSPLIIPVGGLCEGRIRPCFFSLYLPSSSQDTIVVHDPAYLDTLDASTGKGLPSFDVQRFAEYHKHASHHPSPLRPIQVGEGAWNPGLIWGIAECMEVQGVTVPQAYHASPHHPNHSDPS